MSQSDTNQEPVDDRTGASKCISRGYRDPASRMAALLGRPPCHAMTLLEVCISAFCSMLIIGSAMMSLIQASWEAALTAQHTAAMCLCQERLETIRADPNIAHITTDNYPSETNLQLTHTESPSSIEITCSRTVAITDISTAAETAKRINVLVSWTYRNKPSRNRSRASFMISNNHHTAEKTVRTGWRHSCFTLPKS